MRRQGRQDRVLERALPGLEGNRGRRQSTCRSRRRCEEGFCRAPGRGEVLLGDVSLTTDAAGKAGFNAALTVADPLRDGRGELVLTATATGADGTSELSNSLVVARSR